MMDVVIPKHATGSSFNFAMLCSGAGVRCGSAMIDGGSQQPRARLRRRICPLEARGVVIGTCRPFFCGISLSLGRRW
jgi:hypothetical protein